MAVIRNEKLYDIECVLSDGASTVTSSEAGEVSAAATYYDTGGALVEGNIVIEVLTMDIADSDGLYTFSLQGDSSSAFATALVDLVAIPMGDATQLVGASDITTGRYVIPFTNMIGTTIKRYLRIYCTITETTPSATYKAWIVPK